MLFYKNEIGSSLVWVLVVGATLSTLGMGYAVVSRNELAIAENQYFAVDAFYIAQAGLDYGKKYVADNLEDMDRNVSLHSIYTKQYFNELGVGEVEIWVEKETNTKWWVKSIGYIEDATHTLSHSFTWPLPNNEGLTNPDFYDVDFSLLSRQYPEWKNNCSIATGGIELDDDSTNTLLDALESDVVDGESQLGNHLKEKANRVYDDDDAFFDEVANGKSQNATVNLGESIHYLDSNLSLGNNISFGNGGILFVNGDIDIKNNINLQSNSSEPLVLIAKGDITIKNNVNIHNLILLTVGNGDLTLNNNINASKSLLATGSDFYAHNNIVASTTSIVGGTIEFKNNVTVYDNSGNYSWLEQAGMGNGDFTWDRWQDNGSR